jgi:hypothetical protein
VLTAANTYAYATTISASALLDRSRSAGMTANGTLDISGLPAARQLQACPAAAPSRSALRR